MDTFFKEYDLRLEVFSEERLCRSEKVRYK